MTPGRWDDLGALTPAELAARLLDNLDELMRNSLSSPEQEDELLFTLPEPLSLLWYLNWLEFEVSQGSLLAYLSNSHGRHHGQAATALRRIGAHRMASVVQRAADVVAINQADWSRRRNELDALPEFSVVHPYRDLAGADEIAALTDEFWVAAEQEDWGEKLEAYLGAHRREVMDWAMVTRS